MKIGFMKDLSLSITRDTFLFDCQAAGWDRQIRCACRDVLTDFIQFAGDITVQELTPDHVRMYIADLASQPSQRKKHTYLMKKHYAVIRTWIRWLYAQKLITE